MPNIYLTEQGGYVSKNGGLLVFKKEGEKIIECPLKDVSMLVLFGNIQVSVQAMLALLEQGCDIAMMTENGHFRGRVVSVMGKQSELREQQFLKSKDVKYILNFSKSIVKGKLENGYRLLYDYYRNPNNPYDGEELEELKSRISDMDSAESAESLRGYEGSFAKIYFKGFARCFTKQVNFKGRVYFPSTDPVNALLSFGYAFVSRELQGILEALGLDPYIGFFHTIKYGRASLSLDMVEEFRHALVDRLVLRIFNKGILGEEDFYMDEAKGGCYLNRDALRVFIKHYEEITDSSNVTYGEDLKITFRSVFWKQMEHLKRAISGIDDKYQPFLWE